METGRPKKEINVRHDILLKAQHIFDDFKEYTDGVRVMFLMHRHKEGGETNNTKLRKVVTNGSKEWFNALCELLTEKQKSGNQEYRIYAALNPRNVDKAIRKFKQEQLDNDYNPNEVRQGFYLDIKNRFIGCLMSPSARDSSLFLWDCDTNEAHEKSLMAISDIEYKINEGFLLLKQYKTKNGWHIITTPFNPNELKPINDMEIKKDALILLDY